MNINEIKLTVCFITGAIGSFIAQLFGGWTTDMVTLCIFMIIDYVTGVVVAGVFKKSNKTESGGLSSKIGFKGLAKKGIMLLFVLIAYRLDLTLGLNYIKTMTIIGFIINELISILENAGLMGITSKPIESAIDILQNRIKKGDEEYGNKADNGEKGNQPE